MKRALEAWREEIRGKGQALSFYVGLLLTKGGRSLFTELLQGLGEGVATLNGAAGTLWTCRSGRNAISVEEVISMKMTFTKPFSEPLLASSTAKLEGWKGLLGPPCTWPHPLCPHSGHLKLAGLPLAWKGSFLVLGWFFISRSLPLSPSSHVLRKYIHEIKAYIISPQSLSPGM